MKRVRSDAGTPRGIRTPDLLLRRQLLYPAELLAHIISPHQRPTVTQIKAPRSGFDLEKEEGACGYEAFPASPDRCAFLAHRYALTQAGEA